MGLNESSASLLPRGQQLRRWCDPRQTPTTCPATTTPAMIAGVEARPYKRRPVPWTDSGWGRGPGPVCQTQIPALNPVIDVGSSDHRIYPGVDLPDERRQHSFVIRNSREGKGIGAHVGHGAGSRRGSGRSSACARPPSFSALPLIAPSAVCCCRGGGRAAAPRGASFVCAHCAWAGLGLVRPQTGGRRQKPGGRALRIGRPPRAARGALALVGRCGADVRADSLEDAHTSGRGRLESTNDPSGRAGG